MQITFSMEATAASNGAKKGDTVAIKVSARSWLLGTILSKRGGNFNVDTHDGEYQIEVADEGDILKKVDLSYMTAKALKAAMKQDYTSAQLKALKAPAVVVKEKPAKPKTSKTPPAKTQTSKGKAFKAFVGGRKTTQDYNDRAWFVVDTNHDILVRGPFKTHQAARNSINHGALTDGSEEAIRGSDAQSHGLSLILPVVAGDPSLPTDTARAPKAKPAPVAAPKISAFTFRDTYSTTPLTPETMPAGLDNPATYAASLYGRVVTTGRASSHMSDVVIVGNADFKGRTCWVGYPHRNRTGKPRLLYFPIMSVTAKMVSSPQIGYHDFLKFRNLAAQSLNSLNDSRDQVNQKSLEVQNTLAIRAGYRALITFSNGNFWKEILEVDPVKRVIYIAGSRTKRRTVPFALIKQVAVINGDQNPAVETQIVPSATPTAPAPTGNSIADPFLQRVYKKLNRATFRPHAGDDLVLKPGPGEYSDVYVSVDHLVSNDVMVLTVSRGQMKANTVVFVRKVGIWNENDPALPAAYKKYL